MADNTLTAILTQILAKGMMTLRQPCLMTRLVNTDYSLEAKKKGQTIDIPLSTAMSAEDVSPAATPSAPTALTPKVAQITLDNWMHADFGLNDMEVGRIRADQDFIPLQMQEAFKSLANAINTSVFDTYKGVYGYVGTAGDTPFGTGVEVASATSLRRVLHEQSCPKDNRRAVLDYAAEAAALNLAPFSDAEKRGSSATKTTGELGNIFGFDWNSDDGVPTHTRGAIGAGDLTVNGVNAKGATSVSIAKGSGTSWEAVEGDIISFAGDTQTYVITADTTVVHTDNTSVPIAPALKIATEGSEEVTTRDSHVVNLGFHRDAFGLAMRSPDAGIKDLLGQGKAGNVMESVILQDPVTKLIMRLELIRGYKMTMWDVDCLWGTALVDSARAARLAG